MSRKNKRASRFLISILISLSLLFLTIFIANQTSKTQLQKSEAFSNENIFEYETNTKIEGVIVKYKDEEEKENIEKYTQISEETPKKIAERTYRIKTLNVEETIEKIKKEKRDKIEYIEPDYYYNYYFTPNDPLFKEQWYLKKTKAEEGWDMSKGKENVLVAVIDSGIASHNDLNSKVIESVTFATRDAYDRVGHGTFVSGIIGAITDNKIGIASVGFKTKLIAVKIGDRKGIQLSDAIAGIRWAADRGVDIINLSWGGSDRSKALEEAINYAWSKGIFIVAAAGNEKTTRMIYPAAYNNVFAVAATDENDSKAKFSNYGNWVDIAAPGVNIISTWKDNNDYKKGDGTSFSSPIIAGVAALIKAQFPNYTNAQIEQKLCETADKINGTGNYWKCGRVNAYRALAGTTPTTPSPTVTSSPNPTTTPQPTPTLPPNPDKVISFRVRFQGINQKANDQNVDFEIYQDSSLVLKKKAQTISNDSNGIYTLYIDNSEGKISPGKYTIRIKGESHLGKKYQDIEIKSKNDTVDLTNQEEKAGDLNNDNKITIADIAQVLSFYVTFSKDVDPNNSKMVSSDVNKDGKITIIDVALTALNWSDLTINGE